MAFSPSCNLKELHILLHLIINQVLENKNYTKRRYSRRLKLGTHLTRPKGQSSRNYWPISYYDLTNMPSISLQKKHKIINTKHCFQRKPETHEQLVSPKIMFTKFAHNHLEESMINSFHGKTMDYFTTLDFILHVQLLLSLIITCISYSYHNLRTYLISQIQPMSSKFSNI